MNPFAVFDIAPSFDLDLPELEAKHRELSRVLHPDRHVGAPTGQRRMALGRAIEVNEAWRKLRDPISRAEALCDVYGLSHGEGAEPKAAPELLMEMMELREALSDARRAKDLSAVEALSKQVSQRQAQELSALSQAFRGMTPSSATGAAVSPAPSAPGATTAADTGGPSVLQSLGKLRYFRRFLEEANAILDDLD